MNEQKHEQQRSDAEITMADEQWDFIRNRADVAGQIICGGAGRDEGDGTVRLKDQSGGGYDRGKGRELDGLFLTKIFFLLQYTYANLFRTVMQMQHCSHRSGEIDQG